MNEYLFNKSVSNLERYPYIKNVNTEVVTNNQLADITIDIDEEIRTGNVLVAGTFNADTGAGLSFGIEDKNISKTIEEAKTIEKNSNQILDFTREVKGLPEKDKIKIIEEEKYNDKIPKLTAFDPPTIIRSNAKTN